MPTTNFFMNMVKAARQAPGSDSVGAPLPGQAESPCWQPQLPKTPCAQEQHLSATPNPHKHGANPPAGGMQSTEISHPSARLSMLCT